MRQRISQLGPLAATMMAGLLLAGMTVERWARPRPADAEPYHQQIRLLAGQFPTRVQSWSSVEVEIPEGALKLLRPNALISRRYEDEQTGRSFSLLFIQCRDARHLAGHYPLNCYPANGWSLAESLPYTWPIGHSLMKGMWYRFEQVFVGLTRQLHVANLLILPDGRLSCDMKDVYDLAADYTRRFYGAGQIQFVFNGPWPRYERNRVVQLFLQHLEPLIRKIQRGVDP